MNSLMQDGHKKLDLLEIYSKLGADPNFSNKSNPLSFPLKKFIFPNNRNDLKMENRRAATHIAIAYHIYVIL